MNNIKVIIPFRDRGLDPRRAANLEVVRAWWDVHDFDVAVVDDGLDGGSQFNRHRAYNRAVEAFPETDVFVFTEADMLIRPLQVRIAAQHALDSPGLVVPFLQYRYLSDSASAIIRDQCHDLSPKGRAMFFRASAVSRQQGIFAVPPVRTMEGGKSIGAVNVLSRETLNMTGGFTEATSGNWYDDNIIEEGFAYLTGRATRYVSGPAVHLYHLPGHKGEHLSKEDRRATANNKRLLTLMRLHIQRGDRLAVRTLMATRDLTAARG